MRNPLDWLRRSPVPAPEAFPEEWAAFLREHSAHHRRLPRRLRRTFEQEVKRFVAGRRITPIQTDVDDPLRLLVAASAVTLSVGWGPYKWSEVSEVLLYPDDFDREYGIGGRELAGIAHVWGTVILSVPSLWHSFICDDDDSYHLGFHEFAHLLTFERGLHTAIPVGLPSARIPLWENVQARELERVAAGDSIIDRYSLQPSEFFPCAVEAFFQRPIALRHGHRKLYAFLAGYFHQNPALWESRLGQS
jgi:Mlc titration factor MtfA (ptsG expression regulator)